MTLAIIDVNNKVTNVVISDQMLPNSVELTDGGIGWIYNPKTETFTPPVVIASPLDEFNAKVEAGFDYNGIVLGLQENDRVQFTQLITMIQEGLQLNLITNDAPIYVKDINGAPHEISVQNLRTALFSYGMYFKTLWDNYNRSI